MSDAPSYVLSKYLQSLRLDDDTIVVAHGLRLQRMVLAEAMYDALMLFGDEPLTCDEFIDGIELPGVAAPRETLAAMFRAFAEKGFIVPAAAFDEDERVRGDVRARLVSAVPFDRYQMPHRLALDHFEVPPAMARTLRHVNVLLLGGCLIQLAEEPLRALAASRGLTVAVRSGWLTDTHLLTSEPTDLVVLQPGVHRLLAPLWGGAAFFASEEQRRATLEELKAEITRIVRALDDFSGYVLVQGLSMLQMPPHGRADARLPTGHARIVAELNELMRGLVADRPNMQFVDEERLAGNHGKATLFDDMVALSAHHGPLDPTLPRLLAREYLDCYVVLSGMGRIKCVITDLDNTLWRGVVGEGPTPPNPSAEPFPGLHEALLILKERGILLASCSRNNRDDALAFWGGIADPSCVRPDDFAIHCINWEPKSENVALILDKLGLAADAVLFLDDNPVERAEVQARFPEIRVLGDDLAGVRRALLCDPCLQPNLISDEARARTATTRAKIDRDEARARAADPQAFLRSLEVQLRIARVGSRLHFDRLVELSQRTNQFNTTMTRYDARALERLVADEGAALFALAARDRFAPYGLVGLCVVAGERIESVTISCRTIGLKLDQPLLATVVAETGLWQRRAIGRIVEGERNHPCRRIFSDAGFVAIGDGLFAREPTATAPAVDASIYRVELCSEEALTRF